MGNRLKPKHFRSWSRPKRDLMFLSWEIDIKLCLCLFHVTMILHCHWWEFWSRDTDVVIILSIMSVKNKNLLNSNNKRYKPKFVRLLWDIVVFILVAYLLHYDFGPVLYQFLAAGTSNNSYRSGSNHEVLRFQPIPPFIFPLQSL